MEFYLLRVIVLLIGSAIASYTDLKSGYIYDKITYPMIAIGLIINLFEKELIQIYLLAGIVFVLGYLLYFTGKIGGGDVKLFIGVSLLMPFLNSSIPFILLVLFSSGVISIVVLSVYYSIKYFKKGIELNLIKSKLPVTLFLSILLIVYFYFLYNFKVISLIPFIALIVIAVCALIFLLLEKGIRKEFFLKKIKLKDLEEDEIIALEFASEELVKKLELNGKSILGEKEVKQLKELKVKEVPVYRNLPKFAPFVFLGIIGSLLFPNLMDLFFMLK